MAMCDDVGDPTESEDEEEPLVILGNMVLTTVRIIVPQCHTFSSTTV